MTDPIILSAAAIATLAFQEFIKSSAGEAAKKFTAAAIAKMGQLRELIRSRLAGKHPIAEEALAKANAGEQTGIDTVATLLGVEMLDEDFAGQVRAIAELVRQEILKSNSGTEINQTVTGNHNQVIGQVSGGQVFGTVQGTIHLTKP